MSLRKQIFAGFNSPNPNILGTFELTQFIVFPLCVALACYVQIARYVNDTRGNKLIPADPKARAIMEQWISLEQGTITPECQSIHHNAYITISVQLNGVTLTDSFFSRLCRFCTCYV